MNPIPLNNLFDVDNRIETLQDIISSLQNVIEELGKKNKENYWYDGLFLLEDSEEIYGMCFVAFQVYIVGTISDLKTWGLNDKIRKTPKHTFYLEDSSRVKCLMTKVEVIITLANYFKHKDEGLNELTRANLSKLGLLDSEQPINDGLGLLSQSYDLEQIISDLKDWRKVLDSKFSKNGD